MVEPSDYADRLQAALTRANWDCKKLAAKLGVTYQAVKKVMDGGTRALSAANNAEAALLLDVDPNWLATGRGALAAHGTWPFSEQLLGAARAADLVTLRRAENAARAALDLEMLPRTENRAAA